MDSTVAGAAVTVAACVAGVIARVLVVQITPRALPRRTRIEEEGRTARINAVGEGGTLQERDETGQSPGSAPRSTGEGRQPWTVWRVTPHPPPYRARGARQRRR